MGDDGRVTPVMKVKLSISGDALDKGVSQVRFHPTCPVPTCLSCGTEIMIVIVVCVSVHDGKVVWAGPGLLATATGESMIRMWDVANEENYVLPLSSVGHGVTRTDQAVSLAFNPIQRFLAAGR